MATAPPQLVAQYLQPDATFSSELKQQNAETVLVEKVSGHMFVKNTKIAYLHQPLGKRCVRG